MSDAQPHWNKISDAAGKVRVQGYDFIKEGLHKENLPITGGLVATGVIVAGINYNISLSRKDAKQQSELLKKDIELLKKDIDSLTTNVDAVAGEMRELRQVLLGSFMGAALGRGAAPLSTTEQGKH